ncbi:MAG TPA: hypothetical protein VNY04_04620, partial [Chthoniobacterales bacterium]|nr:hypothetical protein [Chthoniobacterales bacterium]
FKLLVHRLLNPFGFAAGQLAVFQGASEAPIPHHFDTGGREPDLQERKMVRDAPSSRLAGGVGTGAHGNSASAAS